ncbi:hypothetical protein GCM10010319_57790 [Streptomyces blastmyceticus]|uniref:Uncharacterized protein n=1 Tax=Streptomyces blastmyceticus TaxID=68180 RepID=A0ABP3HJB1_9ACTN
MPPTAAATRPARSGAPVARAMPRESGTAIRKTTTEAERSRRQADPPEMCFPLRCESVESAVLDVSVVFVD